MAPDPPDPDPPTHLSGSISLASLEAKNQNDWRGLFSKKPISVYCGCPIDFTHDDLLNDTRKILELSIVGVQ